MGMGTLFFPRYYVLFPDNSNLKLQRISQPFKCGKKKSATYKIKDMFE